MRNTNTVLLNGVTATGASAAIATDQFNDFTFFIRATSVTTGCTLVWEASPDNINWHTVQSISVLANGNTVQKQQGSFPFTRANITARTDGQYTVTLTAKKGSQVTG
jgi:hypothetical protein